MFSKEEANQNGWAAEPCSSYSDTKPMPFKTDIPLVPTVTCPGWRLRAEQEMEPDLAQVCPERRLVLLLGRVLASEHKTTLRKLLGGRGRDMPCAELLNRPGLMLKTSAHYSLPPSLLEERLLLLGTEQKFWN